MPPSLENPFRRPFRSKREAEEISDLLLGKEKNKMAENDEEITKDIPGIQLSREELTKAEQIENKPWTREQMEEWVEKFNLEENWIDANLEENADGTWTGKNLQLPFVKKAEDFPKGIIKVLRNLNLGGLTSADDIILPHSIGGNLNLRGITSPEGLTLPASIGRDLNLASLTSMEGLILPKTIHGSLYLNKLTSTEGLILPETVHRDLDLRSLTSIEGLTLPKFVDGYLNLANITSAKGLTFPESIGGDLFLDRLTSADGLVLPDGYRGRLNLESLPWEERKALQQKYPYATFH